MIGLGPQSFSNKFHDALCSGVAVNLQSAAVNSVRNICLFLEFR